MTHEPIPFFIPWITKEDKKAILKALESRWLTGGPRTREFEKKFADYVGTKQAVAVNSCTAALHLALRAIDIKAGDEVIVPDLTFAATANAAIFCGAKPVFADIDEKTFNISPQDVLERITARTKAIVPVHYGGQPCDMSEIMEIAEDHQLSIVEDCAHSLGSTYKDQQTGTFGKVGCFSFYPTKMITTLEGGMATTNDEKAADRMRILREHGMSRTAIDREKGAAWYYDVIDLGYNYRLTEIQSVLGISQLERIQSGIRRRIEAANYYTKKIRQHLLKGITPPYKAPDRSHVFHLYVIKIDKDVTGVSRNELFQKLSKEGIGLSVHYTPLHRLSFYRNIVKKAKKPFPVAERVSDQVLSLPLFPTMSKESIDFIVKKTLEAIT
jgi:perosamine synthetase